MPPQAPLQALPQAPLQAALQAPLQAAPRAPLQAIMPALSQSVVERTYDQHNPKRIFIDRQLRTFQEPPQITQMQMLVDQQAHFQKMLLAQQQAFLTKMMQK